MKGFCLQNKYEGTPEIQLTHEKINLLMIMFKNLYQLHDDKNLNIHTFNLTWKES